MFPTNRAGNHRAAGTLRRPGLLLLVLAFVAVAGGIVASPAATGIPEPPTQPTQAAEGARPPVIPTGAEVRLVLAPTDAKVWLGDGQAYTATATVRVGPDQAFPTAVDTRRWSVDVTSFTRFSITRRGRRSGRCEQATCTPSTVGAHTVTGAFPAWPGHLVQGTATLRAERPVERLVLEPTEATIRAGGYQTYAASGFAKGDRPLGDVTSQTELRIGGPGFCGGASCTSTELGKYTVTGTLRQVGRDPVTATAELTVERDPTTTTTTSTTTTTITTTSTTTTTIMTTSTTTTQPPTTTERPPTTTQPPTTTEPPTTATPQPSPTTTTQPPTTPTTEPPTTARTSTTTTTVGPRDLARVEVRPARASITAGASQAYAVEGFAGDGSSLGDLTAETSFSISPDGRCDGASCSATTAGSHVVTGTVTQGGRRIGGSAELQVLHRQPAISSIEPGSTFAGMAVEVRGNTGSCSRGGTLILHGMDGPVPVPVAADQQGDFVARVTVPRGTFPRAYGLELTVDCNGQLQRARGQLGVLNLAPVAADDTARTVQGTRVPIAVTANDRNHDPDTGYRTLVVESSPPAHGTTEARPDHTMVYTPEQGFVGQDRFRYGFCDDVINAAGGADCGTATVTVTVEDAAGCLPSPGSAPSIQVDPSKGRRGATLAITARVDRKLVPCPFQLLLGGTPLGPEVRAGPDGTIAVQREVPSHATPGPSPVRLATMTGQGLAEASFRVVPPGLSLPLKILFGAGALLAGALARAAVGRLRAAPKRRARHEPHQPHGDLRAEPHASPAQVTVAPGHDGTRTFTVRLDPHHDAGSQIVQEVHP